MSCDENTLREVALYLRSQRDTAEYAHRDALKYWDQYATRLEKMGAHDQLVPRGLRTIVQTIWCRWRCQKWYQRAETTRQTAEKYRELEAALNCGNYLSIYNELSFEIEQITLTTQAGNMGRMWIADAPSVYEQERINHLQRMCNGLLAGF